MRVAAAKQRAAQAAEENRTGRLETRHSSSEPQSAGAMMVKNTTAPAQVDGVGMLTKKATPTQSLSPSMIAAPMTRRAPNAPASAQTSAQASGPMTQHATGRPTAPDSAFATASNKTLPGVDPSWGPSATPAQQARNIENTKKAAEQRQQEAVKTQQTAAAARTPSNTQNKGALQSALERFNLSPAALTTRAPGRDLRERVLASRANATAATPQRAPARTPDQMAADVGEQPMTGSVGPHGKNVPADVARVQAALVQNGAMHPATATGYIGTQTLEDIKAFQKKHDLKIDGLIAPGGPTEAALMDGSIDQSRAELEQQKFGKGVQVTFLDRPLDDTFSNGVESFHRVITEALDGTAAKRRADDKKKNEQAKRAYNQYMQQSYPGYEFGGNNLTKPYNNNATDATKKKVAKEIGIIAGKELIGGAAKITSIPVGKKSNLAGTALDLLGDDLLDSAQKDKDAWGY